MSSRRERRREATTPKRGRLTLAALAMVIVACVVVAVWSSVSNWTYALPTEGPSPSVTAPRPTPTETATPKPAPSPTPTPEPATPDCSEPWAFAAETTISIPLAGIEKRPVTEFTSANLEMVTVWSNELQQNVDVPNSLVPGEDPATIAWYSSVSLGKSILSVCATNTVYFSGHSYPNGGAAFNNVPYLPVGAELIIETPTERLTYTLQEAEGLNADGTEAVGGSFFINKDALYFDSRYTDAVPHRLVAITCFTGGTYVDGHSTTNALSTFMLTNAEYLVEPPKPLNPRVVDRLF